MIVEKKISGEIFGITISRNSQKVFFLLMGHKQINLGQMINFYLRIKLEYFGILMENTYQGQFLIRINKYQYFGQEENMSRLFEQSLIKAIYFRLKIESFHLTVQNNFRFSWNLIKIEEGIFNKQSSKNINDGILCKFIYMVICFNIQRIHKKDEYPVTQEFVDNYKQQLIFYKMNFSNENNSLGGYLITNRVELTTEKVLQQYNKRKQRLEKLSIQIKFTQDHQIVYSKEGAILRMQKLLTSNKRDKVCDAFQNPEIFNNLDYIHYLFWQGQYCKNKMKVGKWIVFWDKVFVKNVGGYYKDGEKQGIWIDLFLNYQNQAQIFTSGEYYNNFKMGFWKYIYQDKMIGGGYQNKFGQKQGKWIELDDGFCNSKQVTFEGEYKMKGMKVDRWNIMYCFQEKMDLKKCKYFSIIRNVIFIYSGGGSYYQLKEQKKIGKWVELDEGFYDSKQVTDNGEYNKEGMKIGRWDINFCKYNESHYRTMDIIFVFSGGGSYDEEVGQKKIGKWVELDEGFDTY